MQTIDSLVRSVQIIAVVLTVLLLLFAAAGFYFYKFHRNRNRVKEESIDYGNFRRADSIEYVKFDDVTENKKKIHWRHCL